MLALAIWLISILTVYNLGDAIDDSALDRPSSAWHFLIISGPCLILPLRRIIPTVAVVAGGFAQAVMWATELPDYYLATGLLLYTAAAHGGKRGRRWSWAVGAALSAYTLLGFLVDQVPVYAVAIVVLFSTAATAIGANQAGRQAYVAAVEDRAVDAELSRLAKQERALTEERNRIARELHDVVAHGLSVIVVQAAAAQRILERDTAGANASLQQIEKTGRNALADMRQVLSVVRTDPADSWRPPQGLDNLDELVAKLTGTGLDVSVEGHAEAGTSDLPTTVDLTAFRIVQESLTNVLKHAGPGVKASVRINRSPDSLDLMVTDNGRGSAAEDQGGHGLRGMQERVEVFGGEFFAGPRLGGGFAVRVSLPLDEARTP